MQQLSVTVQISFIKFIKFVLVGCTGMVVDFAITYLLKEKFRVNKFLSNGIGFLMASTNNFIINRYWTFVSHDPQVGVQYFKFILVSVIGLLFSSSIIFIVHDRMKYNFYFAKMAAILIVVIWNFSTNAFFTFQ